MRAAHTAAIGGPTPGTLEYDGRHIESTGPRLATDPEQLQAATACR
ncbi:hypothetical protein [Ideonella sp. A 288]|nr:hypothetical protein [Ideonella sp. A 288]